MTFNVQLLVDTLALWDASYTLMNRANNIAAGIVAIPEHDRPDLICFNEAWFKPAASRLADRLKAFWPYSVWTLDDPWFGGVAHRTAVNNGLMIVSRLPFKTFPRPLSDRNLPSGGGLGGGGSAYLHHDDTVLGIKYDDASDDDAWAEKGCMVVRVEHETYGTINVAATHLQSSYKNDDQYEDIRQKQLQQMYKMLSWAYEDTPEAWDKTFFMGDLNIRGDSNGGMTQYDKLLVGSSDFAQHFSEQWPRMHPPGNPDKDIIDPGITNRDAKEGILKRLDYVMIGRRPHKDLMLRFGLQPYYMCNRFQNLSDHNSLEAEIGDRQPHCTPSSAVVLDSLSPEAGSVREQSWVRSDRDYKGWMFVERPGSYVVSEVGRWDYPMAVFRTDDLTHAYEPVRKVELDKVVTQKGELAPFAKLSGVGKEATATVFALDVPGFFRADVSHLDRGDHDTSRWFIMALNGDSKESAPSLLPWKSEPTPWPTIALNADDTRWYRFTPSTASSLAPYAHRLSIEDASGAGTKCRVLNDQGDELAAGSGTKVELEIKADGGEVLYLTVQRASPNSQTINVAWRPQLTYLSGNKSKPLMLYCADETGIDWTGSDEISIRFMSDAKILFNGYWGDADTDDALPSADCPEWGNLSGQNRLSFADPLTLRLREIEGPLVADDKGQIDIEVLGTDDPGPQTFERDIKVHTGRYIVRGVLTRS